MAIEIGTSTDWKDLLADLRTFVTSNGWTSEAYTTEVADEDPDTLYLSGPGPTGTEDVHVNIRTGADVSEGWYWWEIRGAILYDSGLVFENQPGTSDDTYMMSWDDTIDYWFYVNDRRIIVVAKVSTTYRTMYAGFFLPWATPAEYPYPLYIASDYYIPNIYSLTNSGMRCFADPGERAAWLRQPDGTWKIVYNHNFNTGGDDAFENHNGNPELGYYIHPYFTGSGSTGTPGDNLRDRKLREVESITGTQWVVPLTFCPSTASFGVPGIIEGAYHLGGIGLSAEQTFVYGALAATEILTLTTGLPLNNETIVIDTKTYTFQDTLTNSDGNVHIGADETECLDNLIAAITLGAGAGTDYAAAMTLHPTVTAAAGAGDTMDATAKAVGTGGNSIATTETLTNGEWGDTTMSGGTDDTYRIFPNINRNDENHFFAVREI